MSDIVWVTAVGERRPQQTPKRLEFVSFFALARNVAHVHGLASVGALIPADLRMSMLAKMLYVCSSAGTPVILPPKLVVSQICFGIDAFSVFGISGVRFAR